MVSKLHIQSTNQETTLKNTPNYSRIFLKLELLQPSGSFKSRSVSNPLQSPQTPTTNLIVLTPTSGIGNLILSTLTNPSNKDKQIHFYSSSGGNAGLAAVHAARDLGCACTVVVPHSTKPLMIEKLRAAGATEVLQHGASWFEADAYLRETFIENQGEGEDSGSECVNVYVPPFDHPLIWEGAGSMVDEIARQLPALEGHGEGEEFPADAIVCSVGGGGLFNGVVDGLEKYFHSCSETDSKKRKDVHVLAVETQGADSLAHSLSKGEWSSLPAITSQATSLGALCVAEKTLSNAVSPPSGVNVSSVVGSDAEAARGVLRLADELRMQVELACGISLEVAVAGRLREVVPGLGPDSRVVVVVCGGSNVTAEMIAEYRRRIGEGWE